jgi:hypothetical protein
MDSRFTVSPIAFKCNAGSHLRLVTGGGLDYITGVYSGFQILIV